MAYGYKQRPRDNLIILDVPRTFISFAMKLGLGSFLSRSMGVRVGNPEFVTNSALHTPGCAMNICETLLASKVLTLKRQEATAVV